MIYQVSSDFAAKVPDFFFGAVAVRGLDNHKRFEKLDEALAENIAACETFFADTKVKESPLIIPYREAFQSLNINPNKFMCSIEALLTRIAKGKGFPTINTIVDLGNCISIAYKLPIGAHDLDTINKSLDVRLAKEGDTFIAFGSTEEETPDVGEAIYASDNEVRTRRWTWRQSERGKITEDTSSVLFPIDGFASINKEEVLKAIDVFVALLEEFYGQTIEVETGFVDVSHPVFEFFK